MKASAAIPKLLLASRDPHIVRGLAARLAAADIPVGLWSADPDATTERRVRSGEMIVVGAGDLSRLGGGKNGIPWNARVLLSVTVNSVGSALSAAARFDRPRTGDGILLIDRAETPVVALIAMASEGYLALPQSVVASLIEALSIERVAENLSSDDHRILWLLAEGKSNSQISAVLNWPESQVKTRLRYLMRTLHLPNRTAMAVVAYKLGLVGSR